MRVVIVVALPAGTFVLGHIVRYDYAAIYFNLPEIWTSHHGGLSSPGPQRHLAARYAVEGRYSGVSVQIVFYNFARHWPPSRRAGSPGGCAARC